jgi:hypothetical protein
MAQTMVESKKLAKVGRETPLVATLTPEALSFADQGIVPSFKSVGEVQRSELTRTEEAVRAIDNIPPAPISFLQVMDTPNDKGGSITLNWVLSESDQMLPRTVASAIGPSTADMVAGVKGYNIYRSLPGEESQLVGKAGPGQTTFVDATVFNGERYTYSVNPFDDDNVAQSDLARTTMAIRNNVVDQFGVPVYGLFGVDNQVGFDDFFIFADHFGLTVSDVGFDKAFDLSPNNKVDFDDFFVFADNFGRNIKAAGKLVPIRTGLNSDASLSLSTGAELPVAGEETQVQVMLGDFTELMGYGFTLEYDPNDLEFVRVAPVDNNVLGEGALAQPRVISKTDGELSILAYGDAVTEGELGIDLVFQTKGEIEESLIELTAGQLRDGNYAVNQVASLDLIRIETRPETYALRNNYPNPFNPETTIKYQLPENADVRLEIRNVVGQLVRTLVADHQSAGRYTVRWDASNDNGQNLSSGVYFYVLQAGEFRQIKRMLLLK